VPFNSMVNNYEKNNPIPWNMALKMINIECGLANRQLVLVFYFLVSLGISGCTGWETIESRQPSQYEQQLEAQNRQLSTEVERLQQQLLEKQAEVTKLILSQQQTTREVVRTKAKLRSHSSKAETVANIAEVKTVLRAVAEKSLTEEQHGVVRETELMIVMSVDALKEGDIAKASILSNNAQQLIEPIRALQGKNSKKNGSDVVFIVPLTMKVLKTCNVRSGPGMKEVVRFTLNSGVQIKALAYVENWIQIEDDTLGKGWVYYQLLEIVQ